MARNAMLPMRITTPESSARMNQAARFAACGEGWVIPMVLMKAFEMSRRRFIFSGQRAQFRVTGADSSGGFEGESEEAGLHL
jgi:hypothetical protein